MLVKAMQQAIHRFFNAMAFYTRLPAPRWIAHRIDYSSAQLNRASAYFPLMGLFVALWCYGIYILCQQVLPTELSLLLSMASGLLFTGAFHEDGFADACDGFGGGWSQQDILRIMKDSRLGTYGVSGLVFMLAIKFYALLSLANINELVLLFALLISHGLSRALAISLIMFLPYVREDEQSKSKPIAKEWFGLDISLAWVFALLPFALSIHYLHWPNLSQQALVMAAICFGLFLSLYRYLKQRLQGYTGDALGACQQIFEVCIYLMLLSFFNT